MKALSWVLSPSPPFLAPYLSLVALFSLSLHHPALPLTSSSPEREAGTGSRNQREKRRPDGWSGGGRQCGSTPRWSASTRRRGGATPPASSRGSSTSSGYVSVPQPPGDSLPCSSPPSSSAAMPQAPGTNRFGSCLGRRSLALAHLSVHQQRACRISSDFFLISFG